MAAPTKKLTPAAIKSRLKKESIEQAKLEGILPHEWLLRVARGELIKQRRLVVEYYQSGTRRGLEKSRAWVEEEYYADFATRMDAAKAAAPFYAPRLAVQQTNLTPDNQGKTLGDMMKDLSERLPN